MKKHKPKQTTVFSNFSNNKPLRISQLSKLLLDITAGWPKSIDGVLSYPKGDCVGQLTNESQLFAWIDDYARVVWLRTGIPKKEFYEGLKQHTPSFRWATPYPHYPPLPEVIYLKDAPAPKKTGRLDELVGRFCPATPLDAQLLKAAIITPAVGLPPGLRPAMVFTSVQGSKTDNQRGRGTGKTTVVSAIGMLYGGTFSVRSNGNQDRMMSDLLSPQALPLRVAELDNLKSYRFSSEWFESFLTARDFNGHKMYHGHASRPNYVTLFVTVNGAAFSKDMAQRSVVIQLSRPKYTSNWRNKTERLITDYRDEIFADIGWFLAQKPKKLKRLTRWSDWCAQVASRLDNPDDVIAAISARLAEIDQDDATAEDVIDYFAAHIRSHTGYSNIEGKRYFIPSVMASEWLSRMDRRYEGTASAYLKQLEHPRLRYLRTNASRGFVWSGLKASEAIAFTALVHTVAKNGGSAT